MTDVLERELKLSIPLNKQHAVSTALAAYTPQAIRLAASYYDTAERDLARRFAALRVRLENDQWVQTLKMRGDDELSHLEFNHPRPDASLDLSVYENTVAASLFEKLSAPLTLRYQTDVKRLSCMVNQGGSEIELALDYGTIQVGQSCLNISEIEFELKSGPIEAVFAIAQDWLQRFGLLLELRTKSERGDALFMYTQQHTAALQGADAALAIANQPYRIPQSSVAHHDGLSAYYFDASSRFLSQIIRNAAFLAGIDEITPPADLHASYLTLMRVGMRRLRSCRQLFKPWLSNSEKELALALQTQHHTFGTWRDKDMLWLELQPQLIEAGLPAANKLAPPLSQRTAIQEHAKSSAFQLILLQNLAALVQRSSLTEQAYQPAALERLHYRLHRSLQRIQKKARGFEQLSQKKQHDLRNAIKRLRYNLEVLHYPETQPLYKALSKAQDRLGHLCDAYVAYEWYEKNATSKKQKKFAQQWLAEQEQRYLAKSIKALTRLQAHSLVDVNELVAQ